MPPQVTMLDDRGQAFRVNAEDVDAAISQGFRHETEVERADRDAKEFRSEEYGGASGKVGAALAGVARGVTLGGSDAILSALGGGDTLQALKEENPNISIGSEIIGAVGSSFTGVGPAGLVSKAGAKLGAGGTTFLGKAGRAARAGAFEGGAQGAGSYVSQVAIEDKPLSAEGFVASVGSGALFGGVAGGGFSLSEQALVRAKSLFPKAEVTREAVEQAEHAATSEIQTAVNEGDALAAAAREQLRANRLAVSASNAETAAKLNAMKLQEGESRLAREQLRLQQAQARAAGKPVPEAPATAGAPTKAPKKPRKGRKAFEEPSPAEPTVAPTAAPEAAAPVGEGTTELERQLAGTKQALDDGQLFTDIGRRARSAEDAADDVVAAVDPVHGKLADATRELEDAKSALDAWMSKYNTGGKYGKGNVAAFERSQASREVADTMRSKEPGYYSSVPEGEGSALLPRGRQSNFRGTAEQKAAADAEFMAREGNTLERVTSLMEADAAASELAKRATRAKDVAEIAGAASPDDAIAAALRKRIGEHTDIGEDVAEAADVISRYEAASANVTELLGPAAPTGAQARAAGYRNAVGHQQEAAAATAAREADDIAKKLPHDVAIPDPVLKREVGEVAKEGARGFASKAADVGAMLEVLDTLGVPGMPSLRSIPVVGPILSLYLKARAASTVFRRLGGKLPNTTESLVARKAAGMRDRVAAAVDKALDAGAAGARKARPLTGPIGGLGYKLFDASRKPTDEPKKSPGKVGEQHRAYQQRINELVAAQEPNAIRDAVRARLPTSDPALEAALVDVATRKIQFLDSKAPKPLALPTLLKSDGEWKPSKSQLASWGRYVEAAENPIGVLEGLADHGTVSYEAAETLRVVYPELFRAAQRRLLERSPDIAKTLPYARRVSLSILFQVPVDGTMSASFVSYLQQGQQPAAPAAPAQGSPVKQPPTPSISGAVTLGGRYETRLDRRAGA